MEKWPLLNRPPVVVALFQIKYNSAEVQLKDFLQFDSQLKHNFPNRRDNIQVGIDLGGSSIPLGVSKISGTSDAKIGSYIYFSNDQKLKLELSEDTITYIDERPYEGWDKFKNSSISAISSLAAILQNIEIVRTSIRFINRFNFTEFENPQDYFNTLISGSKDEQLLYPLRQYGFRLLMDIPDSDIYSIVNQHVENMCANSFVYTFDIDVLDRQHLIFDKETLAIIMESLREIKNQIFFNNLTNKTIELCS